VKFDGLGPVANRFYETLQRGRANWPKPADCHQIIDRQKPEPYSETGTCGAKVASALAAEPRPRQHLTLPQFLAPLTAPRCPLLGTYRRTMRLSPDCRVIGDCPLASRVQNLPLAQRIDRATRCFTSFLQIEGNSNLFCPYPA
jgi:hypothetical protein